MSNANAYTLKYSYAWPASQYTDSGTANRYTYPSTTNSNTRANTYTNTKLAKDTFVSQAFSSV